MKLTCVHVAILEAQPTRFGRKIVGLMRRLHCNYPWGNIDHFAGYLLAGVYLMRGVVVLGPQIVNAQLGDTLVVHEQLPRVQHQLRAVPYLGRSPGLIVNHVTKVVVVPSVGQDAKIIDLAPEPCTLVEIAGRLSLSVVRQLKLALDNLERVQDAGQLLCPRLHIDQVWRKWCRTLHPFLHCGMQIIPTFKRVRTRLFDALVHVDGLVSAGASLVVLKLAIGPSEWLSQYRLHWRSRLGRWGYVHSYILALVG